MFRTFALALTGAWLLAAGCSEPIDYTGCQSNSQCAEGYLCDPAGDCALGGELSIDAKVLPDAQLGDAAYSVALSARGGLPTYTWEIADRAESLDWLTIGADTGVLQAASAPLTVGADLRLRVVVRDSSNHGAGQTASREFDLTVIECTGDLACHLVDSGRCRQGTRVCQAGALSECQPAGFSIDPDFCGPSCEACPAGRFDFCVDGECRCGAASLCDPAQACCNTTCVDTTSNPLHCGACDLDCARTEHVVQSFCDQGSCDYDLCLGGWQDCNGQRGDGCETEVGTSNCSQCGDDCTNPDPYEHVIDPSCDTINGVCTWLECEEHWEDCDSGDPGCETDLRLPAHCGACGTDCALAEAGASCVVLQDDPPEYFCGCVDDGHCPSTHLCCLGSQAYSTCLPRDVDHCTDCDTGCTVGGGGLSCAIFGIETEYRCGCTSDNNDYDCRGVFSGTSRALCDTGSSECYCGTIGNTCAGTPDDLCCPAGCVSLYGSASNCGRCGVPCASGSCINGACTCSAGIECPSDSGAPNKRFNPDSSCNCVCNYFDADPLVPCPPGQYCCATKGCCLASCATTPNACSNDCLTTWCIDGCCPTNAPCRADGMCQ